MNPNERGIDIYGEFDFFMAEQILTQLHKSEF